MIYGYEELKTYTNEQLEEILGLLRNDLAKAIEIRHHKVGQILFYQDAIKKERE